MKTRRAARLLAVVGGCLVLCTSPACRTIPETASRTHQLDPGDSKRGVLAAFAIAIDQIEARHTDLLKAYKLEIARGKEYWSFSFKQMPETPGGFIAVFVYDDGRVAVMPGM